MTDILIDTIRISGFRGINNLEMTLPRVTILIGTNNSGKTSVLKALQLALGDYSRYLSEEDFNIGINEERATEILVDVRIVPINANGDRSQVFNDEWSTDFGDKIKSEANGNQFVALRTRAKSNLIKGGFDTSRSTLEKWPENTVWRTEKVKETKINSRLLSTPFISIEAQRDLHQELRDKSSFIGRVLSSVEYSPKDVEILESLIKNINDEAVYKSDELQNLKAHLENLNDSFQGSGNAEITPFPKKLRDLSKHFTVHFGESAGCTFSMEYHGMGTRSWASMLTVKAFTEMLTSKHKIEVEPFYPILAVEEPEAHLHPNAQKTLYNQLSISLGQTIVSSHSPYLVAMADITQIRSLRREANGIISNKLSYNISDEDTKILKREITANRGEILFSRALILCEGITEEQVIPAMFEMYFKKSLCNLGITCVSVGGKNYSPFVKLACSFGIPTVIVSDNDGSTRNEIEAQIKRLKTDTGLSLDSNIFNIAYLKEKNDFETELLFTKGLRNEIILALLSLYTNHINNSCYTEKKLQELNLLNDNEILKKMQDSKSSYSGFLADVILENPNNRLVEEMLPQAVIEAFSFVKGWLPI